MPTVLEDQDHDFEDQDHDLEDQDHLKYVILKIKIRSPKQRPLEDQDQITIFILRSRSCPFLHMGQGNKLTAKC